MAAAGRAGQNDESLVETLHAAIEAREGRQLKVVFAAEGQPALLFKPGAGSWNWSATSKLVIPIDNPLETLKTSYSGSTIAHSGRLAPRGTSGIR
jgi:hypothetical protein